jgi:hypothetical protein
MLFGEFKKKRVKGKVVAVERVKACQGSRGID